MSDNLRVLTTKVDTVIPINGGVASVKTINHNPLEKEIIEKVGKWVGFPFTSRRSPIANAVPYGSFYWNGNTMNKSDTAFTVLVSSKTIDGDNMERLLSSLQVGGYIRFKDFVGRVTVLQLVAMTKLTDPGNNDYFELVVNGFPENPNYAYQLNEAEVCMLDFIAKSDFDNMAYYKFKQKGYAANGIKNTGLPGEVGDFYEGAKEYGIYAGTAVYLGDLNGQARANKDNFKIINYIEYDLNP